MDDERWRSGPPPAGYSPAGEELAELRELLLGADRRRILEIERRLDAAGVTGEELAELLPEAIVLRARRDRQLARALAPTIETAISESVRRNPREIATAIFPVLGPAIRKAIAEALAGLAASINHAIEHSISPRGLAWRVEGWRTGVPYAQVVLKHALIYRVEQVFLIHADTSLLLAQAAPPDRALADADLVSGMLTAIRDFVGDAFGPEREAGGLRTFCVGELTVLVEQGPAAILAAVVRGQAPESLHQRLQETLEAVHSQFAAALTQFDGDAAPFEPAVPLLEGCLETRLSTDRPGETRGRALWLPLGHRRDAHRSDCRLADRSVQPRVERRAGSTPSRARNRPRECGARLGPVAPVRVARSARGRPGRRARFARPRYRPGDRPLGTVPLGASGIRARPRRGRPADPARCAPA